MQFAYVSVLAQDCSQRGPLDAFCPFAHNHSKFAPKAGPMFIWQKTNHTRPCGWSSPSPTASCLHSSVGDQGCDTMVCPLSESSVDGIVITNSARVWKAWGEKKTENKNKNSHTSDLQTGILVGTLPDALHDGVSVWTGWPG